MPVRRGPVGEPAAGGATRGRGGSRGDPTAIITALEGRGVTLDDAQELAAMFTNIEARGQFGAEITLRDGRIRRADRVVAFHDTDWGRYLYLLLTAAEHPG